MKNKQMVLLRAIYIPDMMHSVIRVFEFNAEEQKFICITSPEVNYSLEYVADDELFKVMKIVLEQDEVGEWIFRSKHKISNSRLFNRSFMSQFKQQRYKSYVVIPNSKQSCFNCANNKHKGDITKPVSCDKVATSELMHQDDWGICYKKQQLLGGSVVCHQ